MNSRNCPKSNLNQLEETNTDIDFSLFVTGIFHANENLIVKRIGCITSNLMITVYKINLFRDKFLGKYIKGKMLVQY